MPFKNILLFKSIADVSVYVKQRVSPKEMKAVIHSIAFYYKKFICNEENIYQRRRQVDVHDDVVVVDKYFLHYKIL
jgi:uncharacterized protein with von Willebrand factor type A (vWA) domain